MGSTFFEYQLKQKKDKKKGNWKWNIGISSLSSLPRKYYSVKECQELLSVCLCEDCFLIWNLEVSELGIL